MKKRICKRTWLLLVLCVMMSAAVPRPYRAATEAVKSSGAGTAKKKKLITGWYTKDGHTWYFNKQGKKVTGWKTIKGKQYYFRTSGRYRGTVTTGWMKAGKSWYFFDKKGIYQPKRSANASRASDNTGTARQKTIRRAKAIVSTITTGKMSKAQKLKVCFDYVMKSYSGSRPRTPHYYGLDWPVVYANDMFLDGAGNCFSYAAAFAYLAKACGYKNVYCCNSTGHGWAEIDGLVYDPEQCKSMGKKLYGVPYSSVPKYKAAISQGQAFMHVKI